jgi:hypothetical protein
MSTWISRAGAGLAALALTGCSGFVDVGRAAPQTVSVAGDSVVISGPPGYCVDRSAVRDDLDGAFVLLGSCASISRDASRPHPEAPGLLTVTVSNGIIDNGNTTGFLEDLAAFFKTDDGRSALSRDGTAASVELVETRIEDDILYLHAKDSSGQALGVADEYWRALFGVRDRLLTVTVVAYSSSPLTEVDGVSTLDAFTNRIRRDNAIDEEAG